jgi:hypothetical protein
MRQQFGERVTGADCSPALEQDRREVSSKDNIQRASACPGVRLLGQAGF